MSKTLLDNGLKKKEYIMSAVLLLTEPDTTDQGTISTFLQSRIHSSFTLAADQLYAMGLLTTDDRIAISSCIGEALSTFTDIMAEKVSDAANIEVPLEVAQEILRNALLLVAKHSHDKCMKCSKPPEYELMWADGRAHAWFCEKHLKDFIAEDPDRKNGSDIPEIKELPEGKAYKHTGENPGPNVKGLFIKALKIKTVNELETAWIYAFATSLISLAKSGDCGKCKEPSDKLEKHRMKPGWQGGEYVDDNIKLLCPDCHKKVHIEEGTFEMGGEWRHENLVKDLGQEGYSAWQSDRGKERQQQIKDELGDDGYSNYQREVALKRWHPDWFDKDGNRIKDDDGNPIAKAAEMSKDDFMEELSELEHKQWMNWSKELAKTEDISEERLKRWKKDWIPYEKLSDDKKEFDREYAVHIMDLIDKKLPEVDAATIPKTLAVDLDNTILSYENGWQGPTIFGEPLPGAKETLKKLKEDGWFIMINTCRSEIPLIVQHLTLYDIPFDAVNENPNQPDTINPNKPFADYRIDDTAIYFDGDWSGIYNEIQERERVKSITGILIKEPKDHFTIKTSAVESDIDRTIMSLLHRTFRLAGFDHPNRWLLFRASICDNNCRIILVTPDFAAFTKYNTLPDTIDSSEALGLFTALARSVYKDRNGLAIGFVELDSREAHGVYDPENGILYNSNNIQNLWVTQPQDYPDPAYWGTPTKLKEIYRNKKEKEKESQEESSDDDVREGSVLDFPRNTLDPAIWEYIEGSDLPRLRQDVKYTIRNTLVDWARHDIGIDDDSESWLIALYFIGSAATSQWRETSDIDITVIINEDLIRQYIGDECTFGGVGSISSCFGAAAGAMVNGYKIGQHPVNYWMQPEEKPVDSADAIYNLDTDVWIKPPPELPEGFDPSESFAHIRAEAILWARGFDLSINELRRDIADFLDIEEYLSEVSGPLQHVLEKRLRLKNDTINARTKRILDDFLKIKLQRTQAFETPMDIVRPSYVSRNWAPAALIYKWLERYGYLDLTKRILHVYKDAPEGINSVAKVLALQEVIA